MTTYCPAAYDGHRNATVRCNLLPGHVGLHDDGIGDRWADDTATPGPDRPEVAAVNLLGSYAAWDALRPALEQAVGLHAAEGAVNAIHGVLVGWVDGEMQEEAAARRGTCPHCGRDRALRKDGTLVVHYPEPVQPPSSARCPGSRDTEPTGEASRVNP